MRLINRTVNYLYRKYAALLNNVFFFENWTRGASHLNVPTIENIGLARAALTF